MEMWCRRTMSPEGSGSAGEESVLRRSRYLKSGAPTAATVSDQCCMTACRSTCFLLGQGELFTVSVEHS